MENIVYGSVISLIDEYRNLLSLLGIELVFAIHLFPWRPHKRIRIIAALLMLIAFGFVALAPSNGLKNTSNPSFLYLFILLWYVFVIAYATAIIAFLFRLGWSELIWVLLTSYAVHHLVYVLVNEFLFVGFLGEYYTFFRMIGVYIPVAVLLYLAVYRLFRPILTDSSFLISVHHSGMYVLSISLFLLIFVASTFINMHNALSTGELNYLAAVSDFSNCLFVIVAQYAFTRYRKSDSDRMMVEVILQNEKTQYESFRRSVDYINIKAHDLRHEIQAIRRSGGSEEKLREISQELDHYATFLQTGNDTLDIILSDKAKSCQTLGIDLICMADAQYLNHVAESDMYSLFGNIIENAIEYVNHINDPEYRYIRLSVKPAPGGTLIREENYLTDDLVLVDGLPQTSKGDTQVHGFGLKSVRFITEKYGGQMMVSAEDHEFSVSCLIPSAQKQVT